MKRAELDNAKCDWAACVEEHSKVYFHGKCHPYSPMRVVYEKKTGEVVISCAECRNEIARVEVAK
jgi:hypothetical protein